MANIIPSLKVQDVIDKGPEFIVLYLFLFLFLGGSGTELFSLFERMSMDEHE